MSNKDLPSNGKPIESPRQSNGGEQQNKLEEMLKRALSTRQNVETMLSEVDEKRVIAVLESTMDEEILRFFAGSRNGAQRVAVAKNLNTPEEVLRSLAGNYEDFVVLSALAANPKTPKDIVKGFFYNLDLHLKHTADPDLEVLILLDNLSSNPDLSEDIILNLYKMFPTGRSAELIAANPSTPSFILKDMINRFEHPEIPSEVVDDTFGHSLKVPRPSVKQVESARKQLKNRPSIFN